MTEPAGIRCVAPATVAAGERFALKIKLLGPVRKIECSGNFNDRKPALRGPFNLNVRRKIQYHDNCLPEWSGRLKADAGTQPAAGPRTLEFDGVHQGVFPGDTRPIRTFGGFALDTPGFHFIRLSDMKSGVEGWSNPIHVTARKPVNRIFWGDAHWQTFFSDGIRCPEELYAFARDEGFLDFGAIADHMEAVTDRQWDYFQNVTNDFNAPDRFVTLIGQEWTHHNPAGGAPGHRNVYYSGRGGPPLRSNDGDCDTLAKLWRKLDGIRNMRALAVPHHSASVTMGVDWEQGWNPKYEKAVEIHSVWGSSEKHRDDGNMMPTEHCRGEKRGRHVVDALKRGYRFGFIGGGDIHDGRPGDQLHNISYPPGTEKFHPAGFTAVMAPRLTRAAVFNAIARGHTYAASESRIYLDAVFRKRGRRQRLKLAAASEEGIREAIIVLNGEDHETLAPGGDGRVLAQKRDLCMQPGDFAYVRVVTGKRKLAWSSPYWA